MYKKLILGSPGTGKTTRLLSILQDKLLTVQPERIAFFSFTKKAVSEAIERAESKFSLDRKRFKYFKTLHSLAFTATNQNTNNVINYHHLKRLEKITGFKLSFGKIAEEEIVEKGDKFIFAENHARYTKVDLKQVWSEHLPDIDWSEFKWFVDVYNKYKQENNVIDFTDMLQAFMNTDIDLPLEIAFIDEAQDLNPLEWDIVNKAISNCKEVYIAGDDDQAIYEWSGADVNHFLTMPITEKEVLPVTYRLPAPIYDFANTLVKRISHRYEKEWKPLDRDGQVIFHNELSHIDFEGQWLILVRNNYQIRTIQDKLRERGIYYATKYGSSIDAQHLKLIQAYISKQKGTATSAETDLIYSVFKTSKQWYEALIQISLPDREYYRSLLRNGIKFSEAPTIMINTIHGSKGGEADNVLLLTDISQKVYDHMQKNENTEHRVFYVGCTRARHNLHILIPQTTLFYQM